MIFLILILFAVPCHATSQVSIESVYVVNGTTTSFTGKQSIAPVFVTNLNNQVLSSTVTIPVGLIDLSTTANRNEVGLATASLRSDITAAQAALSTAVYATEFYADPSWITSLATSKIDLSTTANKNDVGLSTASLRLDITAAQAALSTAAYLSSTQTFTGVNTFGVVSASSVSVTGNYFNVGGSTLIVNNGRVSIGNMSASSPTYLTVYTATTTGTGGNISSASVSGQTWWVHDFLASGSFVAPTVGISTINIIAVGGGGGGDSGGGGGGGAVINYLSYPVASGISYTVTVGTGGIGIVEAAPYLAGKGMPSSFVGASISTTATGGGGAGVTPGSDGANGGGGYSATSLKTGGVGLQGYNGGNTLHFGSPYPGAGGGGAGGAGGHTLANNVAGSGGSGSTVTVYSGLSYCFGGGGGGSTYLGGGTKGSASCGGAVVGTDGGVGVTAIANYGGGGSAAGSLKLSGTGGSGRVIVSYISTAAALTSLATYYYNALDVAGPIVTSSSITASIYIGSGTSLTGIGILSSTQTFTGSNTFKDITASSITVTGPAFSVGLSTFVVVGGNVGIGTTNPTSELTIVSGRVAGTAPHFDFQGGKATGQGLVVAFTRSATTQQSSFGFQTVNALGADGFIINPIGVTRRLLFGSGISGATTVATDDTYGFGIGNYAAMSQASYGGFGAIFSASGNMVIAGTSTVKGSAFSVGGSTLVVSGGNVGIGMTSPGYKLMLSSGVFWNDGSPSGIVTNSSITANNATLTGTNLGFGLTVSSNVSMAGLVYTKNNNVGIGTTNPASTLDISGQRWENGYAAGVYATNYSGNTLSSGTVVEPLPVAGYKIAFTTSTADSISAVGTIYDTSCSELAVCRVCNEGICYAKLKAGTDCATSNMYVRSGNPEGFALCESNPSANFHNGEIGQIAEFTTSATGPTIYMWAHRN